MRSVDCSVLVPVLNEERHILESVAAMVRQRFPGRVEFLLVDGGSTDRTPELLERLARTDDRIRVLHNPKRITPSALNVALGHARGRWAARMDAHTEYPDDYLMLGVERLKHGDTRWVSGPQLATGRDSVSRAVALALRSPLGRGGSRKWGSADGSVDQEYELDSGVFAGVWERETLLEYGGWDEDWLRNQDSEMAGRFLANGERLVCLPAMAAKYTPRSSLRSLWRQYLGYGEFRAKTAVRHPLTMRRSHLLAPALVVCVVTSVLARGRLRTFARGGVGVYGLVLAGAGVQASADAADPREAALVPIVLAVMHLAHGAGMFRGALRNGPPLAAIARVLGLQSLAERLWTEPPPVFAPSLTRESEAPRRRSER